jgi:hypothetical protein
VSAIGEGSRHGTDVDVCIVSFNSAPVIARTMLSIATHLPDATIAIREHGSDASMLEMLREVAGSCPSKVRLDVDTTNPGFGAGCNALAKASTAEWLLFLNPDADIVRWPWDATHPPPTGQITGPHMLGAGESERQSGRSYRVRDEIARSWLRRSGGLPDGSGFVSGAALLIDRHSFDVIDGFDTEYFMFYEDIDFCLRANEAGIPTHLADDWHVHHEGAHSTRAHFSDSLMWSYESACRFHAARGSSVLGYRAYVAIDSCLRAARATVRRDADQPRAYAKLARRSLRELARRR